LGIKVLTTVRTTPL